MVTKILSYVTVYGAQKGNSLAHYSRPIHISKKCDRVRHNRTNSGNFMLFFSIILIFKANIGEKKCYSGKTGYRLLYKRKRV